MYFNISFPSRYNMQTLVTGGSGFLGSHVADALSDVGHDVTIYEILESRYLGSNQKMVIGNILDRKKMFHTMKEIDVVFHMAAMADLDATWKNPYDTFKTNILGTVSVLEACRLNNVKRIILASSLYVNSRTAPIYRTSKYSSELIIKSYYEYCRLEYVILRFGTLYGLRAKENNSILRLLKEGLANRIDYYGTGDEVREYIHVKDAAHICTTLLDSKYTNSTVILTGYQRIKISELLDMINEILDNKVEINYHPLENKSHYKLTPYSYSKGSSKRIIPNTSVDLGEGLVEILEEME